MTSCVNSSDKNNQSELILSANREAQWRFSLGKGNVLNEIKIFNRWGNLISTNNQTTKQQTVVLWDGYTTSGEPTAAGVYYYVLIYTDANGEQHKKNGYVTLIK